jgi:predicted NACHT family NTPase
MGELAGAFSSLLLESLREGRVLLLVDGLDEIADSGKRVAFVTQLRTFLSTYPGVDVVVTSREVGFRVVAGSLSAHCDHYQIADFSREDIERLTVAWHREVVGDRAEVESQARSLAARIWETDRVRRLAVNPLLLTTLLLVRRWVGQIPNRRSVLYEKAIEVLLWTWNVQGFEPLDVQEVVPQLAFLAWRMMEDKVQRISQPYLRETLQAARSQMPEVLAYARLSVSE